MKTTIQARPSTRRTHRLRKAMATATAVAGISGATVMATATGASASNPFERGPAPTSSSIEANGTFAVSTTSVSSLVSGFGGGKIYYPTATSAGTFGAVAVSPGYTERQSDIAWFGPRLASHGFVVFTIDTITTLDQPDSRARQLNAALDYLVSSSSVRSRVDANRLAVMGHSMGGGGSLEAARTRPGLKAAIPLTPWHTTKSWSKVSVPTLIIGAQNDFIAPVSSHAIPFYNGLPSSTKKSYVELRSAGHLATNSTNKTVSRFTVSWLKRWVDNDTRYSPFLCNVSTSTAISKFQSNCPF